VTDRRRSTPPASTATQRRARRAAAAGRRPVTPARPWWQSPRVLIVGAITVGIGALIVLGFVSRATAKAYTCDTQIAAPAGEVPAEGTEQTDAGNAHVPAGSTIRYAACPPTSGSHWNAAGFGPIRPGFYAPGSKAEPGGWVHNLEHGYIVVLYRGEPAAADLDAVRRFVDLSPATGSATACGYRAKIIVARFDEMTTPFAVLAWHHLLQLETWDETKALAFAQRWIETAPEPRSC
jgi:hypothetical protein